MSSLQDDNAIRSLAGYLYQIKVFMYYALQLNVDESVSFEKIDDICIESLEQFKDLDLCSLNSESEKRYTAIQVKKTNLNIEKIILNWLLLFKGHSVEKFILFQHKEYKKRNFDDLKIDELYAKVQSSETKKNSLHYKVKQLKLSEEEFSENIESIIKMTTYINEIEVISEINEILSKKLLCDAISDEIALLRIKYVIDSIHNTLTENILNGKSYSLNYKELTVLLNNSIGNNTESESIPDYLVFKKGVDLEKTVDTREYRQLSFIKDKNFINLQMINGLYYHAFRDMNINRSSYHRAELYEETAFENYTLELCKFKESGSKNYLNLLDETQKRENNTDNVQIKKGVCIYLTGEKIDKARQITWMVDEDE